MGLGVMQDLRLGKTGGNENRLEIKWALDKDGWCAMLSLEFHPIGIRDFLNKYVLLILHCGQSLESVYSREACCNKWENNLQGLGDSPQVVQMVISTSQTKDDCFFIHAIGVPPLFSCMWTHLATEKLYQVGGLELAMIIVFILQYPTSTDGEVLQCLGHAPIVTIF